MNKKSAFTLAEVLITLSIIGVISALTMPSLVTNYNKRIYAASVQKFYNQISTALSNYKSDHRVDSVRKAYNSQANAEDFLTKYFNVTKDCGYGRIWTNSCLADSYQTLSKRALTLDNNTPRENAKIKESAGYSRAELEAMGTRDLLSFMDKYENILCDCNRHPDWDNCTAHGSGGATWGNESIIWCQYTYIPNADYQCVQLNTGATACINTSGHVVFDINGIKKPNMKGRDLFSFSIISDGSIADGEETDCNNAKSTSGCFTKLMNNNWSMDY